MSDQPPDGTDPEVPAANTAGGKARAADMPYHDEKRLGDETPFYRRWALPLLLVLGVLAVAGLFLFLNGGEDDEPTTTTETTAPPTTTTTAVTTTTVPPPTTIDDIDPGEPCSPEEGLPDCIDPDGDGASTYVPGGADCLAAQPADPLDCADNDGDGQAGPPIGNVT